MHYNEIDPHAAQWLRNLIAGGEIPAGWVTSISAGNPFDSSSIA
jgi:hypothetical protein